ncbi:hypothetical protein GGR57DRAFT_497032 [Xylariaceae sp. FL1272]|nr:hypothetical protein GGR57DRAFT_497032 [Xylariaceae sp. FL1272]
MAAPTPDNALPLEAFDLSLLPRCTHNIAWSPDAELAVAADDCVLVFVPDFSERPKQISDRPRYDGARQYNEIALRFPVTPPKPAELNRHLFEAVDQEFDGYKFFTGAGTGAISGQGSTMNHAVALNWSPAGLGRTSRSVLAVLTAAGIITIYCQGASDSSDSVKTRVLHPWVSAWCVGGGMLVPAAPGLEAFSGKEQIRAFSWAKDTDDDYALLSYMNGENEIVILSVRCKHDFKADPAHPGKWRVVELARFVVDGPHPKADPTDPDYTSSNSSFGLSWSPWLKKGMTKCGIVSYVSHNHVGFRQISVTHRRLKSEDPTVEVSQEDASGVCLHLSPDAFVVWEDLVWTIGSSKICRGIIATPIRVQAFDVPFDGTSSIPRHSTDRCGTTYLEEDDMAYDKNPVTGLVIHPPSLSQNTSAPSYSLVRLSATHKNTSWHQTNLPLPTNPEDPASEVRWATEISQTIERRLPRALAHRTRSEGSDRSDTSSDEESDSELDEDSEPDSDSETKSEILGMSGMDLSEQVYVDRVRIWGLTASPGGGTTAIFISIHSAIDLGKDKSAGHKCRVLFGTHSRPGGKDDIVMTKDLSTEAKAWEWLYGGGPPVAGLSSLAVEKGAELKSVFETTAARQVCTFCGLPLAPNGNSSVCAEGHAFEQCANTGVPILAPGISNVCGVCGLKCLERDTLMSMAPLLISVIKQSISPDKCGACGGKLLV